MRPKSVHPTLYSALLETVGIILLHIKIGPSYSVYAALLETVGIILLHIKIGPPYSILSTVRDRWYYFITFQNGPILLFTQHCRWYYFIT